MKWSVALFLFVSVFASGLPLCRRAAAADLAPQKLAIVNVSFIFENYTKVPDQQRKIDETHKAEENTLQQRFKELAQRNKDLDQFMNKLIENKEQSENMPKLMVNLMEKVCLLLSIKKTKNDEK